MLSEVAGYAPYPERDARAVFSVRVLFIAINTARTTAAHTRGADPAGLGITPGHSRYRHPRGGTPPPPPKDRSVMLAGHRLERTAKCRPSSQLILRRSAGEYAPLTF